MIRVTCLEYVGKILYFFYYLNTLLSHNVCNVLLLLNVMQWWTDNDRDKRKTDEQTNSLSLFLCLGTLKRDRLDQSKGRNTECTNREGRVRPASNRGREREKGRARNRNQAGRQADSGRCEMWFSRSLAVWLDYEEPNDSQSHYCRRHTFTWFFHHNTESISLSQTPLPHSAFSNLFSWLHVPVVVIFAHFEAVAWGLLLPQIKSASASAHRWGCALQPASAWIFVPCKGWLWIMWVADSSVCPL